MALTLIGWINLLPLPTLAGGRILAGLIGLEEMAKASTQIALMALIVVFGVSYGFLEGNSLWTFIVIGGFMTLFLHGTDQRLPIILDESKKIDDGAMKNFASFFVILLLLLLPAKMPLEPIEDWDSEIEIQLNSQYYFDENNEIILTITNPSLINKELMLNFWLETTQNITFEISCLHNHIIEVCEKITINPLSTIEIKISSNKDVKPNQSIDAILLIENLGLKEYHHMTLIPNQQIFATSARWESNNNIISPELCTTINNTIDEVEIHSSPFWELNLIDEILNYGDTRVCVLGNAGFLLSNTENIKTPSIYYNINNTTYSINLLPPINSKLILSPSNGINFTNNFTNISPFEPGKELEISNQNELLCSNNTAHPLMSSSEQIFWNATSSTSRKILPAEINKTLLIELPKKGNLIECNRNNPFESGFYSIKEGPLILVNGTDSKIAWGNTPLWELSECNNCSYEDLNGFINFSMFGPNDDFSVSTRFHGDVVPWKITLDEENLTSIQMLRHIVHGRQLVFQSVLQMHPAPISKFQVN